MTTLMTTLIQTPWKLKMKMSCVMCIWIFLTEIRSSSTDGIEAHGYAGQHVTISCQQSWAWSNKKYFCRDPCDYGDVLVSSDRSPNGRFSLRYLGKGTFTVTITHLQESDSGIYWCGVERVGADTYEKVNLRVYKDISPTTTRLDTTQPLPTSTRQPESQFVKSSSTSRSSEHRPSMTVAVNIFLYAVGGLIAFIILVCGLVVVYHYRKMVKKTEDHVPVRPVNHNDNTVEEVTNAYENDLQDTRNSKQMTSKTLKSNIQNSQSHSLYQNVKLKPDWSDVLYGNL